MLKRLLLHAGVLAAAIFGPIALIAGPRWWNSTGDGSAPSEETRAAQPSSLQSPRGSAGIIDSLPSRREGAAPLEGSSVSHLAEVFRFDITVDWILQRWPRVSTGLARPQWQGYRVPLVTGTTAADLAGALTYYFNAQQQVAQITFSGKTGNARRLIELLTTRYQFTRRLTNDPGLFIYEAVSPEGQLRGILKLRSAQVIKASDPHGRFDVELSLQRPS